MAGVSDLVSYNPPQTSCCLVEMIRSILQELRPSDDKIQDIEQLIQEFGGNSSSPRPSALQSSSSLSSFKEISTISSGGFGVVFQGKHRLDGQKYAIKVIPITLSPGKDDLTSILLGKIREVRFLAQLHHPNIIRYHNSWMDFCETEDPVEFLQRLMKTHREGDSQDWSLPEYSLYEACNDTSLEKTSPSTSQDDSVIETAVNNNSNSNDSIINSKKRIQRSSSDLVLSNVTAKLTKIHLILYLQMELMGQTLMEWKLSTQPPIYLLYHIFSEILQGVEYLHQTNPPVIHCDLKPDNILIRHRFTPSSDDETTTKTDSFTIRPLSQNTAYNCPFEVKIADFGLISVVGSTWAPLPEEGTITYKAPELQEGEVPTPASDIYSLGVIFYEMINHYDTAMERAQSIMDFKSGKVKTATLLDTMVSKDPLKRPSVQEVRYYLEGVYLQDRMDFNPNIGKTKVKQV